MRHYHQIKNERENGGQEDKDALGRRECQIMICLLNSRSVSIITEGECFPRAFTSISGKWADWMGCLVGEQQVGLTFVAFIENLVSVITRDIKQHHSKLFSCPPFGFWIPQKKSSFALLQQRRRGLLASSGDLSFLCHIRFIQSEAYLSKPVSVTWSLAPAQRSALTGPSPLLGCLRNHFRRAKAETTRAKNVFTIKWNHRGR